MREIKFRAFDTVKKKWLDSDELTFSHGNWFKDFRAVEDYVTLPVDNGEVVITQYTGLKDSNGKEIYESDIVQYIERNLKNAFGGHGEPWIKKIKEVRWSEITRSWLVPMGFVKEVEVIGNVFENPELLEEKQ